MTNAYNCVITSYSDYIYFNHVITQSQKSQQLVKSLYFHSQHEKSTELSKLEDALRAALS